MRIKSLVFILIVGVLLIAGCAPSGMQTDPSDSDSNTPDSTQTEATISVETLPSPTLSPAESNNAGSTEPRLASGEVPQMIFDTILADLLTRTGGSMSDVAVEKSEAVVWSDGSIGCPQPGVMYTQALVSGYQVIFRMGDTTYDYHLSGNGAYLLCEDILQSGLPGGTPTK